MAVSLIISKVLIINAIINAQAAILGTKLYTASHAQEVNAIMDFISV